MASLAQLTLLKEQLEIAMKARALLKRMKDAGDTVNLADDNDSAYTVPVTATQTDVIKAVANAAEANIKNIANTAGF